MTTNLPHIQTSVERDEEIERIVEENYRKRDEATARFEEEKREEQRADDERGRGNQRLNDIAVRKRRLEEQRRQPSQRTPSGSDYDAAFSNQVTSFNAALQRFAESEAMTSYAGLDQAVGEMAACCSEMSNLAPHTSNPDKAKRILSNSQKEFFKASRRRWEIQGGGPMGGG
jgi:hypothetical protein